jgi:hypothetical protein
MELFEKWMNESAVEYDHMKNLYNITSTTDISIDGSIFKKGEKYAITWFFLRDIFLASLSETDRAQFNAGVWPCAINLASRHANRLTRQRSVKKCFEILPQDEKVFKTAFLNALLGCETIISPHEGIGRIKNPDLRDELETIHQEIEREYHEQLWAKIFPEIP